MEFPFRKRKKNALNPAEPILPEGMEPAPVPSSEPEEPVTGLFKGKKQRRRDVSALVRQYEEAGLLSDIGQRLLAYKAIDDGCVEMLEKMSGKKRLRGIGTTASGLVLGALAVSAWNPLLLIPSLALMGGGLGRMSTGVDSGEKKWTFSAALAQDANTLIDLQKAASDKIEALVVQTPLLTIAQSSVCDQVALAFPTLKDRFLTSAAKDKLLEDAKPKPPANDPQGPRF